MEVENEYSTLSLEWAVKFVMWTLHAESLSEVTPNSGLKHKMVMLLCSVMDAAIDSRDMSYSGSCSTINFQGASK